MRSVLIAESNTLMAKYFSAVIEGIGYTVCGIAATTDQAAVLVETAHPSLVLMEDDLPGQQDGVAVAKAARDNLAIPVLLVTAEDAPTASARFRSARPAAVLVKPVYAQELWSAMTTHCA